MNMITCTFTYDNLKEREREGKIEGKTKKIRKTERESEEEKDRKIERGREIKQIELLATLEKQSTISYLILISNLFC